MIDIHTHILPGIDDGASDWEETLRLANAAVKDGITAIIATPHHANGKYINAAHEVKQLAERVDKRLNEEGIPLRVLHGQEIRIHDGLPEAWERGELLSLSGSRYMLIELPSSHIPKSMGELMHELAVLGLVPIIAHPERNSAIARDPRLLEEMVMRGAFAQVTSHSLLGGFGRSVERTAWTLCRSGLIHMVSSDAHDTNRRGFRLKEAYQVVGKRLGESYVDYYQSNASRIVSDSPLELMRGEAHVKSTSFSRFLRRLIP
ncbi:tyrosine-protein phosphatase [Paenibacillus sp. PAMC21692]|uniref:tyrosine-protein phosphatase n=1 Tax=Paenibacillus sp. PAMC21692 TaxID=2762320 RepID=UPI00164DC139|nr:CpsB/CapC family capsule biosynthesis tyrosine phosphatase [Paenibacillus sp. PAMC21692]QNK55283.1 protein tyrosine phosphatase [Paenibacillus sp. PAMC21692]